MTLALMSDPFGGAREDAGLRLREGSRIGEGASPRLHGPLGAFECPD